jgi:cell shape-determining protein MreC
MKQEDMNQLLDMVTEQRNKAEAERNLLNTLILDKIREVEALKNEIDELKEENSDLRDSLYSAIYE